MLNSAQVKELFEKEAVLMSSNGDGVLIERVQKMFGKKAASNAGRADKAGYWWNSCGIDDYYVKYLTFEGFKSAAAYANIEEIRRNQQEEGNLMKKSKVNQKGKNSHETKTENDMGLS